MGFRPRQLAFVVFAVSATALCEQAPEARAQGSIEGRTLAPSNDKAPEWEIGALASYLAPPIRGGTSPFGAGFGGRLGLSLANVYMGVRVIDYLGSRDVDLTTHSLLYGGELGYGLRAALGKGNFLTFRPEVGVGALTLFYTTPNATSATATSGPVQARANVDVITTATATAATSSPTRSTSSSSSSSSSVSDSTTVTVSNVYVQPALTVMFSAASNFVAVKGSMLVVPGLSDGTGTSTWLTYGLEAQLGLRF